MSKTRIRYFFPIRCAVRGKGEVRWRDGAIEAAGKIMLFHGKECRVAVPLSEIQRHARHWRSIRGARRIAHMERRKRVLLLVINPGPIAMLSLQ